MCNRMESIAWKSNMRTFAVMVSYLTSSHSGLTSQAADVFFPSFDFAAYRTDDSHDPVGNLQAYFEESEMARLLVSIAITARIVDDRDGHVSSKFNTGCG